MMLATLTASYVALVCVTVHNVVQTEITGTRGPWTIETVVGVALIIVVGMFLWYLRWQKQLDTTAAKEQREDFRAALDRILSHDRENHEQAMSVLRDLSEHQERVAEKLSDLANARRTG
ncbi:MAG: hypothetical protein IT379_16670 [Deltaproteobacteria bacterium]|nr:hypothetical protein [Deltaproteobacteria bacterium]